VLRDEGVRMICVKDWATNEVIELIFLVLSSPLRIACSSAKSARIADRNSGLSAKNADSASNSTEHEPPLLDNMETV
jgi:hypothetical protein